MQERLSQDLHIRVQSGIQYTHECSTMNINLQVYSLLLYVIAHALFVPVDLYRAPCACESRFFRAVLIRSEWS